MTITPAGAYRKTAQKYGQYQVYKKFSHISIAKSKLSRLSRGESGPKKLHHFLASCQTALNISILLFLMDGQIWKSYLVALVLIRSTVLLCTEGLVTTMDLPFRLSLCMVVLLLVSSDSLSAMFFNRDKMKCRENSYFRSASSLIF